LVCFQLILQVFEISLQLLFDLVIDTSFLLYQLFSFLDLLLNVRLLLTPNLLLVKRPCFQRLAHEDPRLLLARLSEIVVRWWVVRAQIRVICTLHERL